MSRASRGADLGQREVGAKIKYGSVTLCFVGSSGGIFKRKREEERKEKVIKWNSVCLALLGQKGEKCYKGTAPRLPSCSFLCLEIEG